MALQMELEQDNELLENRVAHMRQLENDILDINDIFRDLGTMVHEQGDVIG
jgi:t-SNARE complex subunit (syntaxin)